jgi:hypothetical protein
MDASYFSALAGLAGAAIGGMTSFGTTWVTQRAQLREQRVLTTHKQREDLYVDFIKEASRLFADALSHERDEIDDLVKLYAIMAHIRMISSNHVTCAAEGAIDAIIDAYHGPNRTMGQMRSFAKEGGLDPFLDFDKAARLELAMFRTPLRSWLSTRRENDRAQPVEAKDSPGR